jgi:toxin-antitoxin system PIN domain toxin
MSYTIDVNVLLYASDESGELHRRAASFLRESARGPELWCLFWPVLVAYLRIATHPSIFVSPLSPDQALANVADLVSLPHVRSPGEGREFLRILLEAARDGDVRGNLFSDAHLVALMIDSGIRTIYTRDRDFLRFPGLVVRDPFAPVN